ncbi:MAG: hypothetical protein ABL933_04880 [Methyloglobulus sp.]|nr:hypothetical protein [Methyloglobulus sp.]
MTLLQQIKARLTVIEEGLMPKYGCIMLLDGETKDEAIARAWPDETTRPVQVICIRETIVDPPSGANHDRIH